jgi:XamI-like restriction endonuclease
VSTLVSANKPSQWKQDIAASVDFYNSWFMKFAPKAYRETRVKATKQVEDALRWTANLTGLMPSVLRAHPEILEMLRMATAPPIARDRLIGLAQVTPNLVRRMELSRKLPETTPEKALDAELSKICKLILAMADPDILIWLPLNESPSKEDVHRASTIIADRLCGAQSDPIVRNAQEERQLASIREWLERRGYSHVESRKGLKFDQMRPGTFAFRLNVPINLPGSGKQVNIPVDVAIMRRSAARGEMPLLIEAKSAGDFTNPNKRRKEEATKITQIRHTHGNKVRYVLFLCGYFDSGYLGYEAAEGIDWVWEHRLDDLAQLGL